MASHRVLVLAASIPFFVLASIFVGLCTILSIFVVKKTQVEWLFDASGMGMWWISFYYAVDSIIVWLIFIKVIDVGFMTLLFTVTGEDLGIHELNIKLSSYYSLDLADYVFTFLYIDTPGVGSTTFLPGQKHRVYLLSRAQY